MSGTNDSWFTNHPKLKEIHDANCSIGLEDEDVKLVFQIYLDLCEVRGWWNVRIHPATDISMILLSGYQTRAANKSIVIPLRANSDASHETLRKYSEVALGICDKLQHVLIAVADADTTVAYYELETGLVPPNAPLETEDAKYNKRRKRGEKKLLYTR